jgi:hypothetical protein
MHISLASSRCPCFYEMADDDDDRVVAGLADVLVIRQ